MSGWWDSITSNAQLLVDELSAQANEASNEIAIEQMKLRKEEEARQTKSLESLPWESPNEAKSIISQSLMADILQLALAEKNFTVPPPEKIMECCNFDLQLYISQAMRLLSLDQNLAHIHAKLSPKMNEEILWKYYFVRIYYLRCKSGILDNSEDTIVQIVSSFAEEDVIFKADTSGGTSSTSSPKTSHTTMDMESTSKSSPPPKSVTSNSTSPGLGVGGKKPGNWESSSGEEVMMSTSGSEMSTSSYEVVGGSGSGSGRRVKENSVADDDALFEAQLQAELEDTKHNGNHSDVDGDEDEDFDDLEDFNDLDVSDDDDDELEAQIARELANEELLSVVE